MDTVGDFKVKYVGISVTAKANYFDIPNHILSSFYHTKQMETSIQANGIIIIKAKDKLTTQTELSIQDTGIILVVVIMIVMKE